MTSAICEYKGYFLHPEEHRKYFVTDDKKFFVKIIIYDSQTKRDALLNEVRVVKKLKHPNIVQLVNHYDDGKSISAVFENHACDLHHLVYNNHIACVIAKNWLRQLIDAVNYLHTEVKIIHCDIKLENLLLSKTNTLMLTDFEYARPILPPNEFYTDTTGTFTIPEMKHGHWNMSVDIWGVGKFLLDIYEGKRNLTSSESKLLFLGENLTVRNVAKRLTYVNANQHDIMKVLHYTDFNIERCNKRLDILTLRNVEHKLQSNCEKDQ